MGVGGFHVGSITIGATGVGVPVIETDGVIMGFVRIKGAGTAVGVAARAGGCPRDRSIDPKNSTIAAAVTASIMTAALTLRRLFMLVTLFGG